MATWSNMTGKARSRTVIQDATEAEPVSALDGIDLNDVSSILAIVRAPAGQTFTGAGSLLGYLYVMGAWERAPRADVELDEFAALDAAVLPSLPIDSPQGRFCYVPSGVGLSGGTQVTTDYLCTSRRGEHYLCTSRRGEQI
jgi:hypothetical protein